MGYQKTIADKLVAAKTDYALALKDNLRNSMAASACSRTRKPIKVACPLHETIDKDHGRLKICRYTLSRDIAWLEQKSEWTGLQALRRVESIHLIGDKTSIEYRYYLTTFTDLPRFAETMHGHWAIENGQRWVLDA